MSNFANTSSESLDADSAVTSNTSTMSAGEAATLDLSLAAADLNLHGTAQDGADTVSEKMQVEPLSLGVSSVPFPQSSGKRAFAIANTMAQATDLANLYQITVTQLRKRFDAERVLIYQFQSETQGTVIAESLTAGYAPSLGQTVAALAFGASTAQQYRQRGIISISNISEDASTPYQMQLFQNFQVKANLSLPIFLDDHLWGLLVVQNCTAPRRWDDTEIALLYQVVTELTLKLQPLRFQAERQLLASVSDKLRQSSDNETIFRSVTRER